MGSKHPNARKIVFSYSPMCSLKLGNIGSLVSFNSESSKMVTKRQVEVVIENGNIIDIGEKLGDADSFIDCGNNLVTPGFVDSHTHPVFVDTNLLDDLYKKYGKETAIEKLSRQIPLGKIGEPNDVAYAVLYLASDESKFVTGTEIRIDGGISAI